MPSVLFSIALQRPKSSSEQRKQNEDGCHCRPCLVRISSNWTQVQKRKFTYQTKTSTIAKYWSYCCFSVYSVFSEFESLSLSSQPVCPINKKNVFSKYFFMMTFCGEQIFLVHALAIFSDRRNRLQTLIFYGWLEPVEKSGLFYWPAFSITYHL